MYYLKQKQMEKCVLKHLQNVETLDPPSLVTKVLVSDIRPVKPHRKTRRKQAEPKKYVAQQQQRQQ